MQLIKDTFLPFEVDKILRIPISVSGAKDELCLALSKDGVFRVKDVYKHAISSIDHASCSSGPDPLWTKIWKLNVPPKIREFAWHACWDIIPHGVNLSLKGIPNFVYCQRCGSMESLIHLLWDCPWVKDVWSAAKFSFSNLVFYLFLSGSARLGLEMKWSCGGLKICFDFLANLES